MPVPWRWMAKSAIQKAMSVAPDPDALNHRLQEMLGRDEITRKEVNNRAEMCRHHLASFERVGLGSPVDGIDPRTSILELGTGWNPAVPLLLWLCGADRVLSVDHVDHSSGENLIRTVALLRTMIEDGSLATELPALRHDRAGRMTNLADSGASAAEIATAVGFDRRVADVTTLRLDDPPDAVVSNLVLEHIPEPLLAPILASCFDLVAPGGVMSHAVDLCDHGHYIDPSITQFNYLRFSPRAWAIVGNDVQHENRLRASQYLDIYRRSGVPVDHVSSRAGEWAQLAAVPVAPAFAELDADDLLVVFLHVTSIRPADGSDDTSEHAVAQTTST